MKRSSSLSHFVLLFILCFFTLFNSFAYPFNNNSNINSSKSQSSQANLNPAAGWIAGWILDALGGWLFGKALDYAIDRSLLAVKTLQAADNISSVRGMYNLSNNEISVLNNLENNLRKVNQTLNDYRLSDQQTKLMIARMQSEFVREINNIKARIESLEFKLVEVEKRLDKHYLMIVDIQGSVIEIDKRLSKVESAVFPRQNEFPLYKLYVGGGYAMGSTPQLESESLGGLEINIQWNANTYLGALFGYLSAPVQATDVTNNKYNNSPKWENSIFYLGVQLNPLPPQTPVLLRFGGGLAFASNNLVYYAPGVDESKTKGDELGKKQQTGFFLNASLAISPLSWDWMPYMAVSYFKFGEKTAVNLTNVNVNMGDVLLVYSVGLVYRIGYQ